MIGNNSRRPIIPITPTEQERIAPGYLWRDETLYVIEYWQGETAYCHPGTLSELENLRAQMIRLFPD